MIWLISCVSQDIDSAELQHLLEDSAVWEEEPDCPISTDVDEIFFASVPAMSNIQPFDITLSHDCSIPHVLLQSPEEWSDDPMFSISLPSSTLIENETTLTVQFTPHWSNQHNASMVIPYTHPDSPLQLSLSANVAAPIPIMMIGGQLRRTLSHDYGQSILRDTQSTGVQRGVCWGDDTYLITGGMESGRVWRSQNGENWQEHTTDTEAAYACAYGNGRFVMYADGLYSSIAGAQWEEGSDTPWMEDTIRDIHFAENIFVAVGDQGRIATTSHGVQWNRDVLQGNFQLNSVTYGNEKFVAVGNFGAVLWSDDLGESWTTERVSEGNYQRVVFGDGFFYISDGSELYRSEDAIIWNSINTDGVKPLLAYGRILIGIKGQRLYHSFDHGTSWQEQAQMIQTAPLFDAVLGGTR